MGIQHSFKDLTGQKFGRLTVRECLCRAHRVDGKLKSTKWLCDCECGGTAQTTSSSLNTGGTTSCGCAQKQRASEASLKDIAGMRFGRLLAIRRDTNRGSRTTWECVCDCGNTHTTNASSLMTGDVTSCGCFGMESRRSRGDHFMSNSPEYETWLGIKRRCYDENTDSYKYYGALGVLVCDRWLESFTNFYADMGPRPSEYHSIERARVDGMYAPENCHWADPIEQANNKTTSVLLEFRGRVQGLTQWCRELDMDAKTVHARVRTYGWDAERALTTPTSNGFTERAKYLLRSEEASLTNNA